MHAPPFVPYQSESGSSKGACPTVNVAMHERLLSLGIGGMFLFNSLVGFKRTRPLSFLAASGLLYRGLTGHCHAYDLLGIDSAQQDQQQNQAVPKPTVSDD